MALTQKTIFHCSYSINIIYYATRVPVVVPSDGHTWDCRAWSGDFNLWIGCALLSPFFLNWVIHSVTRWRRAGLRGAMGEHLASEGHGGSAGVLFNEVGDQDAQRQTHGVV